MNINKFFRDKLSLRIKDDEFCDHTINNIPKGIDFKLYTMDLSYFSGKLEMYLRYKQIQFERIEPHAQEYETILCTNTSSEQLPQMYDCRPTTKHNKRWLRDTTFIIDHLERDLLISEKSLSVLPECKVQRFMMKLLEDYADEYCWRPAMFWRWEPSFDRKVMGLRFTYEFARTTQSRFLLVPPFLRPYLLSLRQWLLSSHGEGCDTDEKKQVIVDQYYELLEIFESILKEQPYLFGNRPTLVDFAFAGPFFRHFSSDFTPRKIMQNIAPNVYEWIARLWNCTSDKMQNVDANFPAPKTLPKSWDKLLKLLSDYFEYYQLNSNAYAKKDKFFKWINKGHQFTVPVVHYRAWCNQQLSDEFNEYDSDTKNTILDILKEKCGLTNEMCDNFFSSKEYIEPECGIEPPFSLPAHKTKSQLTYKWDAHSIFFPYVLKQSAFMLGYCGLITGSIYCVFKILSNKKSS